MTLDAHQFARLIAKAVSKRLPTDLDRAERTLAAAIEAHGLGERLRFERLHAGLSLSPRSTIERLWEVLVAVHELQAQLRALYAHQEGLEIDQIDHALAPFGIGSLRDDWE
jgi:hypothetical protein